MTADKEDKSHLELLCHKHRWARIQIVWLATCDLPAEPGVRTSCRFPLGCYKEGTG